MPFSKFLPLLLAVGMLCGCGPSARQVAEQQAKDEFRKAVAAMKVCTQGATYKEFREKRLALETCYTANQSALVKESGTIDDLVKDMKATEVLWEWQIRYPLMELSPRGEQWRAMKTITPAVAGKADFTDEQRRKDPDFYANNYVRRGLTMVADQCDLLLAK
jgi:hypothetical protein